MTPKQRAVSEAATDFLFDWLTRPENDVRARDYLDAGAGAVLGGKVRLVASSRLPESLPPDVSQALLSVTATRLSNSFGPDAPDSAYPEGTWAGYAGLRVGILVDYYALADRLLRRFVPEYVPVELPGFDEDDPEA